MATYEEALAAWTRGDMPGVAAHCRALLAAEPAHADALNLLAGALYRQGDNLAASETLSRLLELRPGDAMAHMNLGNLRLARQDIPGAVQAYERALELAPTLTDASYNLGNALKAAGRAPEAVAAYEAVLGAAPQHVGALVNLGNLLGQLRRAPEARARYEAALRCDARCVEALIGLACALADGGRVAEAAEHYQRALALRPGTAEVYQGYGDVLRRLGQYEPARAALERALALAPPRAEVLSSLGLLHAAHGRQDLAREVYERALSLGLPEGHFRAEIYRCAIHLWDRPAMELGAAYVRDAVHAGQPFIEPMLLLMATDRPADQRVAAVNRSLRHVDPTAGITTQGAVRSPLTGPVDARLRVGYVSPDLRDHVVGQSIVEVLERHDRRRIELHLIATSADDQSGIRRRLERGAEHFHDAARDGDVELTARIRALNLDVLVDLASHSYARQAMLVSRPAPIQVAYLGYPGTSGAPWIDYLIADGYVVPPALAEHYTEAVVRLPGCFFPSDTTTPFDALDVTCATEGLPAHGFVFACFNSHARITPERFDTWLRILKRVPDAVLWLQAGDPIARGHLLREAAAAGVAAQRFVFAPRVDPRERHLARHALADLMLDTYPYNTHTTCRDALWAGTPVLTRAGETFASRVAGSLLRSVDLHDLVVTGETGYEALAVELAGDPERMRSLRARLARSRRESPLFDMALLARRLEAAYVEMVKRARAGLVPAPIDVNDLPRA